MNISSMFLFWTSLSFIKISEFNPVLRKMKLWSYFYIDDNNILSGDLKIIIIEIFLPGWMILYSIKAKVLRQVMPTTDWHWIWGNDIIQAAILSGKRK